MKILNHEIFMANGRICIVALDTLEESIQTLHNRAGVVPNREPLRDKDGKFAKYANYNTVKEVSKIDGFQLSDWIKGGHDAKTN